MDLMVIWNAHTVDDTRILVGISCGYKFSLASHLCNCRVLLNQLSSRLVTRHSLTPMITKPQLRTQTRRESCWKKTKKTRQRPIHHWILLCQSIDLCIEDILTCKTSHMQGYPNNNRELKQAISLNHGRKWAFRIPGQWSLSHFQTNRLY